MERKQKSVDILHYTERCLEYFFPFIHVNRGVDKTFEQGSIVVNAEELSIDPQWDEKHF